VEMCWCPLKQFVSEASTCGMQVLYSMILYTVA